MPFIFNFILFFLTNEAPKQRQRTGRDVQRKIIFNALYIDIGSRKVVIEQVQLLQK